MLFDPRSVVFLAGTIRHHSKGGLKAHDWFVIPLCKHATMRVTLMRFGSTLLHHAELLLAFWGSIGFKLGESMTVGMNEKREVWFCRV